MNKMDNTTAIMNKSNEGADRKINFEPNFSGLDGEELAYRKSAWQQFNTLPFPTKKDNKWRRTDLKDLPLEKLFNSSEKKPELEFPPEKMLLSVDGIETGGQVVIINDSSLIELTEKQKRSGVIFTDLKTAYREYFEILGKFIHEIKQPENEKFALLTAAMAANGVFLYVPKNTKIEEPLHSLVWTTGENQAQFTRILIYIDDDSSATFIDEFTSPQKANNDSLFGGLVDIYVGERASLKFIENQSWGENIWNVSYERINVASEGNIEWFFGALGSKVTKKFSTLNLNGEGSSGQVSGFYFTNGKQHLDLNTQQNHFAPHTTSDLLYKGALIGESRSIWQGMVYVAPGAPKADGYQANRNLILDRNARADSIPGLEILTDDVRCTHGATVGKIDPEQLYYLESRGLPKKEAQRIIVEGFFDPIIQKIPLESVKQHFYSTIQEKMNEFHLLQAK